jgi:hypothetical protein
MSGQRRRRYHFCCTAIAEYTAFHPFGNLQTFPASLYPPGNETCWKGASGDWSHRGRFDLWQRWLFVPKIIAYFALKSKNNTYVGVMDESSANRNRYSASGAGDQEDFIGRQESIVLLASPDKFAVLECAASRAAITHAANQ